MFWVTQIFGLGLIGEGAGREPQCPSEGSRPQVSERKHIYRINGPKHICYHTEFRSEKLGDLVEVMDEWKTGYYRRKVCS